MAQRWEQAVVVGAGMSGLLFARVLADRFARVLVVERDRLPPIAESRAGVAQGRHLHALLAGGCRAMEALLPGLVDDIRAAGAMELVTGWSNRVERPGYDPFPRRDLGFSSFSLSRPLLELCVRRRVQSIPNIEIEHGSAVEELLHDGSAITAVALRDGRILNADLVIDASGRGELTLRAFDTLGLARPPTTTIGVDINYATALFKIPDGVQYDWKSVVMLPDIPQSSKITFIAAIEAGRWLCTIGWRGDEPAPTDRAAYVEWTRNLRTQTCYSAIKDAEMIGTVMRYAFPESRHRHFVQLESFPRGLLPVADAICRFNPVYGQGMSVAALEAEAFAGLLNTEHSDADQELSRRFFRLADQIIEGPWTMAALPDFAYADTRGERPADLQDSLKFGQAVTELAARDASVHRLMLEISGLLKPRSALTGDPVLMQRIYAVIAQMAQVEALGGAAGESSAH